MIDSIRNPISQPANTHHHKNNKNAAIKDSLLQPLKPQKQVEPITHEHEEEEEESKPKRETYGLPLLELMTDSEYAAFERITANMSYSQKIMSAQSLYRLTTFQLAEGANYPKEMKNGYGSTINFGDKFNKAVLWGDVSLDKRS